MGQVRVVLVDDHSVFREALAEAIDAQADLHVVAQAKEAREAYAAVERERPELIVLDVNLPGSNGIAAAREILRRDRPPRVLILTMYDEPSWVADAFSARVHGYALKIQPLNEVLEAIRTVARGQIYTAPQLAGMEILRRENGHSRRQGVMGTFEVLSSREREIFDLLVRGRSNPVIASELCISPKTVETHRAHIMKKLGVHSIVELVRYAARHHLLAD